MQGQFSSVLRRYRWKELGLLIIPFMIMILGVTQLLLANADPQSSLSIKNLPTLQGLIPAFGLIGGLLLLNIVFSIFFRSTDQMLLPLVGLLSGIGVLMATRLGPDVGDAALGSRQLLWVLLGFVVCIGAFLLARRVDGLAYFRYSVAIFGFLLLAVTLVNTLRVHNLDSPTHDQLNVGPLNFQPSELLKICVVFFFASFFADYHERLMNTETRLRWLRPLLTRLRFVPDRLLIGRIKLPPPGLLIAPIIMLGVSLLLFLVVRELGLALLIYGIFLCMVYLGTNKIAYVGIFLLFFLVFAFIGYALFSYVRARFTVVGIDVINWPAGSEKLYQSSAFQVVQGLIALSSGGILGAGLGLGTPAFVPVVQSDMVFTALGEELGIAGLFAIIGIYLFIIYRGYRIAMEATSLFSQLLAAGLTSIFALQALIIAAGNMKFLPLTGIPLPFLSYGGSSILANYIIVGILLRISYNSALKRDGIA